MDLNRWTEVVQIWILTDFRISGTPAKGTPDLITDSVINGAYPVYYQIHRELSRPKRKIYSCRQRISKSGSIALLEIGRKIFFSMESLSQHAMFCQTFCLESFPRRNSGEQGYHSEPNSTRYTLERHHFRVVLA